MKPDNFVISACGVKMPGIIYGTAWKKDATALLVEQAIRQGFRGIDTACQPKHYHEAGVGEGIANCLRAGMIDRPDLYLQSKFTPLDGHDPRQIPYDPKAKLGGQVEQSFQTSLKNLQTPYLDGLVLHSPLADLQQLLEVWQAMEQIFHRRDAKQLGISNCYDLQTLEFLYQHAEVKPVVLQNRFYAQTHYDRPLRHYCQQHGIIYQSFWTLTANLGLLAEGLVKSLAAKHQHSPEQVFFRYLTQIGIMPLTGTRSKSHMQEDLAIFDFELSPDECQAVDALLT